MSPLSALMRHPARAFRQRRFLRFLGVGVLNTLFGYTVFYAVLAATGAPAAAVVISTVAGVLFNFRSTGALVFGASHPRLLARFALVYAVVAGVNIGALRALALAGVGPAPGQILLTPFLAVLAYFLQRDFVFAKSDPLGDAS